VDLEVIFHPEAEKEYLDACNWYEAETPGLGHRFKTTVLKQIDRILLNPELYLAKERNYRESITEVFPYVIVYKIGKKRDTLNIVAIYSHQP